MLDALRVLWAALVSLYDEALVLVRGNLLWLVIAVPLYAVSVAVLLPVSWLGANADRASASVWPFLVAALMLVALPSPGLVGLGSLAEAIARRDSPPFAACSSTVRRYWRRGLALYALGGFGLAVLVGNVVFYATVASGPIRFLSVLWLYAVLFWLAMQVYLVPLLLRIPSPRFRDLYRRAALLTLGHLPFSLTLASALLVVAALSILALPVFALLVGAYAALVQARAFRLLRVRHGDVAESEQGGAP